MGKWGVTVGVLRAQTEMRLGVIVRARVCEALLRLCMESLEYAGDIAHVISHNPPPNPLSHISPDSLKAAQTGGERALF